MPKYEIKKVPAEEMDGYDAYDEACMCEYEGEYALVGNHRWIEAGDPIAIQIIQNDYYDDEVGYEYDVAEELSKIMGGEWTKDTLRGYSQGDWQYLWHTEKIDAEQVKRIEACYMGKLTEFTVEDGEDKYVAYVEDEIVWKGKAAICEALGIDPNEATVLVDDGYEKVYKYKEIE